MTKTSLKYILNYYRKRGVVISRQTLTDIIICLKEKNIIPTVNNLMIEISRRLRVNTQ